MCYLVTGTLPLDVDVEAVRRVASPDGAAWLPISNSFIQRQLPVGGYYVVTRRACDCDSPLVQHLYRKEKSEKAMPRRVVEWSAAKQQRWLGQRAQVQAAREAAADVDLSGWCQYLQSLAELVKPACVGILLHWYNESVERERFSVEVAKPIPASDLDEGRLLAWQADRLYEITAKRGRRGCRTSG